MGTDIKDFLQPDGKQVEIELSKVSIYQEKTKGQIRRKDPRLLLKRNESLIAAPPTRPIHVVLLEDNSMFPTDFSLFSLREPSRMDLSFVHRWRLLVCISTTQRCSSFEYSGQATDSMSGFAEVAYHMHGQYSEARYTAGLLCKTGGTSTRKRTGRSADTTVGGSR